MEDEYPIVAVLPSKSTKKWDSRHREMNFRVDRRLVARWRYNQDICGGLTGNNFKCENGNVTSIDGRIKELMDDA